MKRNQKMRAPMRVATSFLKDTAGNFAVTAALSSTVMVGAAGFGLDTYRLENTRTTLDQVVGLTCDRIENADYSLYPSSDERMAMARSFAAEQSKQAKLDPARTQFEVTKDGDKIVVAGASAIDATMMRVLGHDQLDSSSTRNCATPSKAPPLQACTPDDLIYLNPGTFETAAGTLVAGQKNYAATLFDKNGNIKSRQVVGNGSGTTEVFLKASNKDDMVVVQPFNADGTTPAACNPTGACNGNASTCPPPPVEICSREKVEELSRVAFGGRHDSWSNSPGLEAAWKDGALHFTGAASSFSIPTSANFEPEVLDSLKLFYKDSGSVFVSTMAERGASAFPRNLKVNRSNNSGQVARIFRVISFSAAAWEVNSQCMIVVSPIVLDLVGKGKIATSGVSSARYVIPQNGVNATVDFDMGGTGKTVRSEWISGNGQALLVDNRDGKAATDMNGTRLFGTVGGYAHGYEKLATLDANRDGKLSDAELQGLAAWIDNGDAKVQDGELKALAEVGVTELSAVMSEVPTGDGGMHMRSSATLHGKTIMTEDVWFGIDLTARTADASHGQSTPVIK